MSTKFYYGCDEVAHGWKRYFEQCNALELALDPVNTPTIKTLNRWRVESPRGFCFVLHLHPELQSALVETAQRQGSKLSAAALQGWEKTMEQARALAAKALLWRSPFDYSPTQTSRDLMVELAKKAQEAKLPLIWESEGMWNKEATHAFAQEHGIIYAIDPFLWSREELEFGHGDACFILHERAGARRKFDQYDMEELMGFAQPYQRAFVLCRGRFKWDHARELRYVLEYA